MVRCTLVDVFGARPLGGNPVAVVHDADGWSARRMQQLAAWFDLSETVFLQRPPQGADYAVRIFTPGEELPFAGHPTLGAHHAWAAAGGRARHPGQVVQAGEVGLVELRVDATGGAAFAGPPLRREGPVDAADLARVLAVTGLRAEQVLDAAWVDNGPGWVALRVADVTTLRSVTADARRDPARDWYVGLVAPSDEVDGVDLEVRGLFPDGSGALREDPATGSLAAGLGRWLADAGELPAGGRRVLRQGVVLGRDARLEVTRDAEDRIWVAGATTTVVSGELADLGHAPG